MTNPLSVLLLYGLASGALVDLWRNASILAGRRASIEASKHPLLVELSGCEFCLSFQAALWLFLLCFVPSLCVSGSWKLVCQLPVFILATGRMAWLLNGLLPVALRYTRDSDVI